MTAWHDIPCLSGKKKNQNDPVRTKIGAVFQRNLEFVKFLQGEILKIQLYSRVALYA